MDGGFVKNNMTQKDKNNLLRKIKNLLRESYDDYGNSYELEFRGMLEEIVSCWNDLIGSPKVYRKK